MNEKIKILIVDDEEKILSRLARILIKEGYLVNTTPDGTTAEDKLQTNLFDIILTDINLADKSGFEIMEFIRNNGIDTLPLVLTGYASVESAIKAIKLGAYDFIQKPVDAETLKLVINRAAERILLKRENEKNLRKLKKLNDLKDEFLSVVSHDLRSPLSSIGGYANYLLKRGQLNEIQNSYVKIIKEISDDLYFLVNELLDISKLEMGDFQLNKEKTDIVELITTSINNFILLASDKNISIEFYNTLAEHYITIDRIMILQVINNLISNAVKFTENGTITVSVGKNTENHIKISIADSGIGIPEEAINGIFDKYSYFRSGGTRGEKGTGLGLVICKKFVNLHNGNISVSSKPEKGSNFEIILPVGDI